MLDAAPRVSYLLWYNSRGRPEAAGVFTLTLVGFGPTKDSTWFFKPFDFFFWNLLLVFRDPHPFIFGPDIVFINVLYYNWGTVALICIRAVLLILNININIKNKLIYSCCVDHDFINVFPHDWPSEQCCK